MFNKFIKKSSKFFAVVLAITLTFSPLSYAAPAPTTFAELGVAISDGTTPNTIILGDYDFTADTGDTTLGTQGATNLTIKSDGTEVREISGADHASGLTIGSGKITTIENITFQKFSRNNAGGAIYNSGSLTINGANFSSNTFSSVGGGAIYTAKNATTIINGGEFSYNKNKVNTQAYGGAIYNEGRTEIGDGVKFSSNSTENTNNAKTNGGAIYNKADSTVIIGDNVVFESNKAVTTGDGKGGAIANDGDMEIGDGVQFLYNEASTDSGAVGNWADQGKTSTLTIGDRARFSYNSSKDAGALFNKRKNSNAKPITEIGKDVVFSFNTATDSAGAVRNVYNLTIDDGALFEGNTVTGNNGIGGAVYNDGTYGSAILKFLGSVTFKENTASGTDNAQAGAIYNKASTVTISKEAIFNSNTANSYGGAIVNIDNAYMSIGDPTVAEPEEAIKFINNSAGRGGAIDNYGGSEIVIGNKVDFDSNMATLAGAAIFNEQGAKITIGNNVTFDSNKVTTGANNYGGGAIWNNRNSSITLGNNVTFEANESNTAGGAIYNNENSLIILGDYVHFTLNTANTSGGAIYNKGGSVITIGNDAEFEKNEATNGGAIYNDGNSTITIKDGAQFKENVVSADGGAIYNKGTIDIGTSIFVDNTSGSKKIDIYNAGELNFTAEETTTDKTTTMTGGINGGNNQGITTIKEGVTLMVGYDESKQKVDGATFIQNNVILEENANWYINVLLDESNFKITDTVRSEQGAKIYIDGDGNLNWNTEGLGEYHYNGNINIIGDTLEHDTMYIGDNVNTNTVTRTGKTDPENFTTTVNNIQGGNATLVNKGTLNLNLKDSDSYNLKTLTNETDTEKGIFNITIQDNVTLDLSNKTIQQKETTISGDSSKYLKLQNAQLGSDLVNNLSGEGLTLENSTVEGQVLNQNQGQITLDKSQIERQITNNSGTITILDNFTIQNGITSSYPVNQNILNIGDATKSLSAAVVSSTTIQNQTINISSGSLTMNNAENDGSISSSDITITEYGQLVANAGNLTNIINGIQNSGIVEFTGGANNNIIS